VNVFFQRETLGAAFRLIPTEIKTLEELGIPATLHALAGRLEFTNQRMLNLVVSNVPGVQTPLYAGGCRLLETYPLLPVIANLAVVVCVTSYCGDLYVGLVGDYDAVPDLEVFASGLRRGMDRLEMSAVAGAGRRPRPRKTAATPARV